MQFRAVGAGNLGKHQDEFLLLILLIGFSTLDEPPSMWIVPYISTLFSWAQLKYNVHRIFACKAKVDAVPQQEEIKKGANFTALLWSLFKGEFSWNENENLIDGLILHGCAATLPCSASNKCSLPSPPPRQEKSMWPDRETFKKRPIFAYLLWLYSVLYLFH